MFKTFVPLLSGHSSYFIMRWHLLANYCITGQEMAY